MPSSTLARSPDGTMPVSSVDRVEHGSLAPPIVNQVLRSRGQTLDASVRRAMESRWGADFRQVQVHTDPLAAQSAREVQASAYTVSNHVVFASGRYAPGTAEGRRLIAHELAHVMQQNGTRASQLPLTGVRIDNSGEAHAEASAAALDHAAPAHSPITLHPASQVTDGAGHAIRAAIQRETDPQGRRATGGGTSDAGTGSGVTSGGTAPVFKCGPDVRSQLVDVVNRTKSAYAGWTADQKEEACWALENSDCGPVAWDIVEMHNADWIWKDYQPRGCATTGASPPCGQTVKVGAGCHHHGSANYVIFGVMSKLCGMWERTMRAMIWLYKRKSGNYEGSRDWAVAGYNDWPAVPDPAGDRNNCRADPCPYVGSPFTLFWYPVATTETVTPACAAALPAHRDMRDNPPNPYEGGGLGF